MPGPNTAQPITAVVHAEGHPRILERLLAVLASRSYTLTGIRSFLMSDGPAPWLALTMEGLPARADSLLARMASLPHVHVLGRVHELGVMTAPEGPAPEVERTHSGHYRIRLGDRTAEAATPELAAARLATPADASALGVLVEPAADGVRIIGCVRAEGTVRTMGASGPDGVTATLGVFGALARKSDVSDVEEPSAV